MKRGTPPPGVWCFHQSCRELNRTLSKELQSRLGKCLPAGSPRVFSPPAPPPPLPEFDPVKLAKVAAKCPVEVTPQWLGLRSPKCPWNRTPASHLDALYEPGERVLVFSRYKSQGQAIFLHAGHPYDARSLNQFCTGAPLGAWFLNQPIDGEWRVNDNGGRSRRSWQNVTRWRYMVLESDKADPDHWLAALVQMPMAVASICTSGSKSVHALVRVDAKSKEHWDEMAVALKPCLNVLGADVATMTAVRLTRLGNCERLGKLETERDEAGKAIAEHYVRFPEPRLQRLLYLNPAPDCTPIIEQREVASHG